MMLTEAEVLRRAFDPNDPEYSAAWDRMAEKDGYPAARRRAARKWRWIGRISTNNLGFGLILCRNLERRIVEINLLVGSSEFIWRKVR